MLYIILGIVIAILIFFLARKQAIDRSEYQDYQQRLGQVQQDYNDTSQRLTEAENKYGKIIEEYKESVAKNQAELNAFFAEQKELRQEELDNEFVAKRVQLDLELSDKALYYKNQALKVEQESLAAIEAMRQQQKAVEQETENARARLDGILEPLKLYQQEKDKQLFYTIQVPEEYRSDIDFLLTTVAQKVRHPDVISKLVWAEYIRPYIADTFKRVGIEAKPGIYKLTNILNGKSYIGKSTDIKKRIADHMKSSVGILAIADQAVHHEILKEGIWNWAIECVTYCEKEELSDLEKYYIDFFQTQMFGYNRAAGG